MNMISTGTFLPEMDASNKQETLAEKFAAVWEKKNSKAARAGGVSLMALSLAACGSSSDDTAAVETPVVEEPVVEEPTTPVTPTPTVNTITKALLDFASGDTLAGTDGDDVLDLEMNSSLGATTTISGIETINLTSYGATTVNFTKITDVDKFIISDGTGTVTLASVADAAMILGFEGSGTNTMIAGYKAGTLSGSDDTVNISLDGAKAVSLTVDAGFEAISIDTGGAASAAGQAATAASDIDTLSVPGVTKVTATGAGALDIASGVASGLTKLDASDMSGAVTMGTPSTTTGYVTVTAMTGATTGTTMTLGSGADSVGFTSATAASTNTDSLKLGAGDDHIIIDAAGSGSLVVMGEDGDDNIQFVTTALATTDVVNGGDGDDTVLLTGDLTHSLVLRGVENLTLAGTDGATATITSSDTAMNIVNTIAATNDVDIAGINAGSTVTVNAASGTLATAAALDTLTVKYAAAEAASTIDVNVGTEDDFVVVTENITDLTLDFSNVVAEANPTSSITATGTTALTINAAKDMFFGDIAAPATEALKTLTVVGGDKIEFGAIANDAKLETVSITGADNVVVGTIADADTLTSLTVTSTAGSVSTGALGAATGSTTGDPDNIANVTLSAGTTVTADVIEGDIIGDISITGTEGKVQVDDVESAAGMGTVTITAAKGAIDLGNGTVGLIAADTTGITVDMSATTFISEDGTDVNAAAVVTNSKGDVTASLAGAAAANVNYTAGTINTAASAGTVNLNASALTGGLTSTITSHEMAGTTATGQTISLGAKNSSTVNTITLVGHTAGTTVTGSAGKDTVVNSDGGDILGTPTTNSNDTYNLAGGTDTLSYAGSTHDADSGTADAGATTDGYAFNVSGSTYTFFSSSTTATNKTTIAKNTIAQYDSTATASTTATAGSIVAGGETDTFSGVEIFIGSDQADYFIANSAGGSTFEGGIGNDTYVLATGADIVKFSGHTSATNGEDTIGTFQTGDKLDFSSVLTSGGFVNTTNSTTGAITLHTTTALATEGSTIAVADEKVIVIEVALEAGIDTAAEMIVALADGGVADAVDVAASADAIIIVGGADDDTTHYVYGIDNDTTAAVATGELVLLGTITTDITNGVDGLLTTNFVF